MKITSREFGPPMLSVWAAAFGAVAAAAASVALSYKIIVVLADPRTEGRRWMLTWDSVETLIFVLIAGLLLGVSAWTRYRRIKGGDA